MLNARKTNGIKKVCIITIVLLLINVLISVNNLAQHNDSVILNAFNENSKIRILVKLKDYDNMSIEGTKEERLILLKQKDAYFKSITDDILSSLSQKEFENVRKHFNEFSVTITKEGYEKLIKNSNVKRIIHSNVPPPHIALDDSVPLIKVNPYIWNSGYTGKGIKVCVIDTGVNSTHPALNGMILDEYCYCSTPDANISSSNCCPEGLAQSENATDNNGHGTHVVGIIASQDTTYKGVAYSADIYVVKVLNSTGSADNWDDIADAIDWCVMNKSVNVISMSIGNGLEYGADGQHGDCPPTVVDTSINNAYSVGISVIIASGNEGYRKGVSYPGCSPNATSVGSTAVSANTWYHLTGTWDGTFTRLYQNGNLIATSSDLSATPPATTSGELWVGALRNSGIVDEMDGYIDEVRIYNRALSSTEINASYNAELGKSNNSNTWFMNQTMLVDGNYSYYAWVNNSVGGSNSTPVRFISIEVNYSSELAARTAIEQGINSSLTSRIIYTSQQVYGRNLSNSQILGRFDKVVASGSKRWAFNYINSTEAHVRMFNLTPSFYVLEMANMTTNNIINDVSNLINSTK